MLKLQDALNLIRQHNKLQGWTDGQIVHKIQECIQRHALTFTQENGKLTGIIFGEWRDCCETFHVTIIIGKMKLFLQYLKQVFPQCNKITGYRFDKVMTYKVGKDL